MIIYKNKKKEDFILVEKGISADIFVDKDDYWGVNKAVENIGNDIKQVTDIFPEIKNETDMPTEHAVFVGTIGKSKLIDRFISEGILDVDNIVGKWESFVIQVVDDPLPNVKRGLCVAGSDKRGSIFGLYEIAYEIGVSPWYWWADVPVEHRDSLYVKGGTYKYGEPSVKYRGIFLNDEVPGLSTWVNNKFGGFNHCFYEKVFELLLRLKANYLWPAMWKPRVFNEEDPLNPVMADKYGIVMGTSHHEPMMRSWEEWGNTGKGEWNYNTNAENIYEFWQSGLFRVKDYEGIITIGMRGDGDEAMAKNGSQKDNKRILERVIQDQREIIDDLIEDDVCNVPQILALYKEVQGFYENGLKIPDDITLLLSDDNFGNIRLLPEEKDRNRPGGYGVYYHFDYVGGPRSYQWINTVPLQKIWEQMNMTYRYGVDRVWIVNVGDLKPMEFPMEFFLDIAWDIDKWNHTDIDKFSIRWAEKQFGEEDAEDIAEILLKYTKYNGRRKPELIDEETYSIINYREAERVLSDFDNLVEKAEKIYSGLSIDKKDAFFQLVLYPTRASRNILKMHIYAAKNKFYAGQDRVIANEFAELTCTVYEDESLDTVYYNEQMSGGKWYGMMLQPHIGKSGWRGPTENTMPEVKRIAEVSGSEMGVYIEGYRQPLKVGDKSASLPIFNKYQDKKYFLEIFNKKRDPFDFTIIVKDPWIKVSQSYGKVEKQERIWVSIDWERSPLGKEIKGMLIIRGTDKEFEANITIFNPVKPSLNDLEKMTFIEGNRYISIEVEHFYKNKPSDTAKWEKINDYGRTLSSLYITPSNTGSISNIEEAPYLEYKVYIHTTGELQAVVYTAPGLNINRRHGLKYAIAVDDSEPVIIDTFPDNYDADNSCVYWAEGVMNNVHKTKSVHMIREAGLHILKIMMVDPGVVLQKIVLDMGGVKPGYLGPPESFYKR